MTPQNNTRKYRVLEIAVFLTLLISYAYFLPRWGDWSQNSRLDLVLAVVDKGTLKINDYVHNTGDYAHFEDNYYSDKAPGNAFLGMTVYWAVRPILQSAPVQSLLNRIANNPAFSDTLNKSSNGLISDSIYNATVLYAITVVIISIPAALLGLILFHFLMELGVRPLQSVIAVLIYGLATTAFTYGGAFYSHQLVAFLLFTAFYIVFEIKQRKLPAYWVVLSGFMLGFSLITEYPTFLIAAAIAIYTLIILFKMLHGRSSLWFVGYILAGLIPGLLMMLHNWAIFHTPLPVGYEYSELYTDIHSTGFLSLTFPRPDALWGITFSPYRGLFFVAPVLLLGMLGFWSWWSSRIFRSEFVICIWASLSFILFNSSSVMWEGGFSVGPRYVVPMLPFFAVALGLFISRWSAKWWGRLLLIVLTIWSVIVTWAETIGGQGYPPWDTNPFFDYSLPNIAAGNIARNLGMAIGLKGITSLLPLLLILCVFIVIIFRQLREPQFQTGFERIQSSYPAKETR